MRIASRIAAAAVIAIGAASVARAGTEIAGLSAQGRPVLVHRVGAADAPRKVLVVGCIHGDECAAFAVVARLARTAPVAGTELWIVPSVNPDGRRAGTRGNVRGVDLNRNFPYRWRLIPRASRYYSGPRPLSEPESRVTAALIRRIRPSLSIWYHQPERNVRDPDASAAARRYARLVGLPFLALTAPPGTVAEWTEAVIPGAEAFVVELPPGPMSRRAADRHTAAVRTLAR